MADRPVTARARARAAMLEDIRAAGHRQLESEGPGGINLRAIARELGVVSSAVYRYVESRDALLTLLIVDAYDAVGAVAEEAAAAEGTFAERWSALARAVRAWALANPHDWALVYGSPVPGYRAPADTIAPAQRVNAAAVSVVVDGVARGEVAVGDAPAPAPVHRDFEVVRSGLGVELSDDVIGRMLLAWTGLFGHLSYELYGHLHGGISDCDAFFEAQLVRWVAILDGR